MYGTDIGFDKSMYQVTLRILETLDEHFYETDVVRLSLESERLWAFGRNTAEVYRTNAQKLLTARAK